MNIELTKREIDFLKEFASKQYDGAKDNVCTRNAIHCVQTKRHYYVDYHYGIEDRIDGDMCRMCFVLKEDEYPTEYSPEEFVEMYYESNDINKDIEDYDANYGYDLNDCENYFEEHGIFNNEYEILLEIDYWEDVAFFFIRNEAERYLKYQKHNLGKARVYTKSDGYSNYGAFEIFRNLLLRMGEELNDIL